MLHPKLDEALELLQRKDGLLAAVCYAMRVEVTPLGMPTMATTGARILVDPAFLETQPDGTPQTCETLAFGLGHEACHVVFDHLHRCRGRHRGRWNCAGDRVINRSLDHVAPTPEWALKDGTDRDEETLYEAEPEPPEMGKSGCTLLPPEAGSAEEEEASAVEGRVRAAIERAIQAGTAPGWIKERYKPKDVRLPLEALLTWTTRGRQQYSWRRPARASRACGVYLPKLNKRDALGSIMVSVDTSGSRSRDDISKAIGVCCNVAKRNGKRLIVVVQDTEATVVYDGRPEQWNPGTELRSGGGTDFRPLLTLADRMKPDVLVAVTDLCGPMGPKPRTRVLWVSTIDAAQPPFGTLCKV